MTARFKKNEGNEKKLNLLQMRLM